MQHATMTIVTTMPMMIQMMMAAMMPPAIAAAVATEQSEDVESVQYNTKCDVTASAGFLRSFFRSYSQKFVFYKNDIVAWHAYNRIL